MTSKQATIGRKAPDFVLPATGGKDVRLRDLRGENVVVYFYPRDNTPGCTLEGQNFKAYMGNFAGEKPGFLAFPGTA